MLGGAASVGAYVGMVKACLTRLNLLVLLIGVSAVPCAAKYGGGAGTAEEPYLIYTAGQMNQIGANSLDWDKHFALMADINLGIYSQDQFNLIGESGSEPFAGVFDGRGHVISHFTYESDIGGVGLFRYLGEGGVVKNLGLSEPNVAAVVLVGTLVGSVYGGSVESCCVTGGSVDVIFQQAGGLAGDISGGTVINCYVRGTQVTGFSVVGGLAALNDGGLVMNSLAANPVLAPGGQCGAFVGADSNGLYTGCFYDAEVSDGLTGIGDGNDPCGLTGESTANLQQASTFADADWDIVTSDNRAVRNIWRLCEEGVDYPHLAVEYLSADFACPDGVDVLDLAVFVDEWIVELLEADVDFDLDHYVTFTDWATLASAWTSTIGSGDYSVLVDVAPAGGDGVIDGRDVGVFVEFWLAPGSGYLNADIEPYGGDGVVDFADFAAFANQWLEGS